MMPAIQIGSPQPKRHLLLIRDFLWSAHDHANTLDTEDEIDGHVWDWLDARLGT